VIEPRGGVGLAGKSMWKGGGTKKKWGGGQEVTKKL